MRWQGGGWEGRSEEEEDNLDRKRQNGEGGREGGDTGGLWSVE